MSEYAPSVVSTVKILRFVNSSLWVGYNDSFSLYIAVSHMTHILVYYTLLVVIIICIIFVKLRKCWRMLQSALSTQKTRLLSRQMYACVCRDKYL